MLAVSQKGMHGRVRQITVSPFCGGRNYLDGRAVHTRNRRLKRPTRPPSGVNRTGSVALASELGTCDSSTTLERNHWNPYTGFVTSEIAQAGISGGSARKAIVMGPALPPQ